MDSARWGRGLPFEAWPEADRTIWNALVRPGDAFDASGPLAHLRAASTTGHKLAYAQWLKHLVDEGVELSSETPDERATLPRLRHYHLAIGHLALRTQAHRFVRLMRVLSAAYPERNWGSIRNAATTLHRKANDAGPVTNRDDALSSDDLLDTGLSLIAEARAASPLGKREALLWRNGLLVAFLACHVPRCRTLSKLTLGGNLRRSDAGWAVWASPADMKAGRACEFRVSPLLTAEIDAYLATARPLFRNGGDPGHGPLWLSTYGCALSAQSIRHAVARVTHMQAGKRMTPHEFRHAAMTMMARTEGFDSRHGQGLLDQRTPKVAEKHYNLATRLDAGRDFGRLLERLKGTSDRGRR